MTRVAGRGLAKDDPTGQDGMTDTDDSEHETPEGGAVQPAAEQVAEAEPPEPASSAKATSKADKLEARAARLRERDEARARALAEAMSRPHGAPPATVSSTGLVIALCVVAALFVATLSAGIPYVLHLRDQSSSRAHALTSARAADATRATVLADATQYAVDFGSYDYRHLDADFAKVTSHLTPEFAKSYSSVSTQLRQTIVQYKGTSTAQVQGAAVQTISGSTAVVLVFLDQTVKTTQSATARIDRNRVQMTLQRQPNGGWLISNLLLQ